MSTLRVFTAVELPRATRAAIVELGDRLLAAPGEGPARRAWRRGLARVAAENLHATVRFLGSVDERRVPEIVAALRAALTGAERPVPGSARVAGVGAFPGTARPSVVWCGVLDPHGALAGLERAVTAALTPLGFPPEDRPYHPHVTLARVRDGRVAKVLAERLRAPSPAYDVTPAGAALPVERLTLFHSTSSHGTPSQDDRSRGPRYEALARIDIAGAG